MRKFIIAAVISLFASTTVAQDLEKNLGREQAINGHIMDVVSTGIGLALGAVETNPVGIIAPVIKIYLASEIDKAPLEKQPHLWAIYGSLGWAATANNACVILSILTSGGFSIVCPFIGIGTGITYYNSKE